MDEYAQLEVDLLNNSIAMEIEFFREYFLTHITLHGSDSTAVKNYLNVKTEELFSRIKAAVDAFNDKAVNSTKKLKNDFEKARHMIKLLNLSMTITADSTANSKA